MDTSYHFVVGSGAAPDMTAYIPVAVVLVVPLYVGLAFRGTQPVDVGNAADRWAHYLCSTIGFAL